MHDPRGGTGVPLPRSENPLGPDTIVIQATSPVFVHVRWIKF